MYQALYRSFRPETFDQVWGQEHIVRILKNQLATGTVSHAYLFCGTRGTGKTTTARLLAKGLNCRSEQKDEAGNLLKPCGVCDACKAIADGTYMDVIEIDAASNSGVDNIRELRESVKYPPTSGPYKVYIIDEVHMLTTEAFNALLKTLEEPPEGVVFILATTEPQRIPATILSRCLKLDFRRVPETQLKEGLRAVCGKVGVKISDAALGLIAANADGSARDALSLLDQCLSGGDREISRKEVLELLGTSGEEVFLEMTDLMQQKRTGEALVLLARVLADGKDVRQFIKDWMEHYRSLLIAKYVAHPEDLLNLSAENTERLLAQASQISLNAIQEGITQLAKASADAKWSTKPRVLLELAVVRLSAGAEEPKAEAAPKPQPKKAPAAPAESGASAEPAAPAAPAAPAPEADTEAQALWSAVVNEAMQTRASMSVFQSGSYAAQLTDRVLLVQAKSPTAISMASMYRTELERLLAQISGRPLKLTVELEDIPEEELPGGKNASPEARARSLASELGVPVEIE